MFALVHLLKQIRPPVLSGAVIAALRRQLLAKGQEAEAVLSSPIPEKILSDLHRRMLESQAALRRSSLRLPQDETRFRSELDLFLKVLTDHHLIPAEIIKAVDIEVKAETFNVQMATLNAELKPALNPFFHLATDWMAVYTYPDFNWVAANPPFLKWLGIVEFKPFELYWPEHLHPEDHAVTFTAVQSLLEEKETTVRCQNRWRCGIEHSESMYQHRQWTLNRQGDLIYAVGLHPVENLEREPVQMEIKTGVSLRHTLERQQTAILFHELRNPLQGILGGAQLVNSRLSDLLASIEEYGEAPNWELDIALLTQELEKLKKKVKMIEGCGKDQLVILNDVLDLGKLEQGHVVLESKRFALLRHLLQPLLDTYLPLSEAKQVELLSLFPSIEEQLIGDPHRLKQVLINLLGNALKFAAPVEQSPARIEFSVSVQREREQRKLHFKLKNSGRGLNPQQIAQLFKPYVQSDVSITRRFGGTGLGLTVCHQLVSLMQGDITCTSSEQEHWVQFDIHLTLPAAKKRLHLREKEKQAQKSEEKSPLTLQATILLAEDNEINRKIIGRLLRKWGCTVDLAENGRQAVDLYASRHYSLILMDIQMPEMDGLAATRAIREQEKKVSHSTLPPVPIVGLSGNALTEQKEQALAAGMNDYLTKPVIERNLWDKVLQYHRRIPSSSDQDESESHPSKKPPMVLESKRSLRQEQHSPWLFTRKLSVLTELPERTRSHSSECFLPTTPRVPLPSPVGENPDRTGLIISTLTDDLGEVKFHSLLPSTPRSDQGSVEWDFFHRASLPGTVPRRSSMSDSVETRISDPPLFLDQPTLARPSSPLGSSGHGRLFSRCQETKTALREEEGLPTATDWQQQWLEVKTDVPKQTRVILQAMDHYFRQALVDHHTMLASLSITTGDSHPGELKVWMGRLGQLYEEITTPEPQSLAAAAALSSWQAWQEQALLTSHQGLQSLAKQQITLWQERFRTSNRLAFIPTQRTSCCIIS